MYQAKNHKDAVAVDTQDSRLAAQKDVLGEKPVILLVDDSMMNRMMLAGILGEDYRILEAENGKQCLELLRANAGQTRWCCWISICRSWTALRCCAP
mgnify:CR=1 FL=1